MAYTPLKNYFDARLLDQLSDKIATLGVSFDHKKFKKETTLSLDSLELKDRTYLIADQLQKYLPGSYSDQIEVLINILGPPNPESYGTFMKYFWTWTISAFIERHGLNDEKLSLKAIKEVTKRGTGEFAIRPFLRKNPAGILKVMNKWSLDKNFHVRRLSSEGLRPNLPWATKLTIFIEEPEPVFSILENLKNDPEKYVQTSVANMINDYFKVNFEAASDIITKWSANPEEHTKWIIKHAIRNYRKKNEEWALELTEKMNL